MRGQSTIRPGLQFRFCFEDPVRTAASEIDRIIAHHQSAFDGDAWHGDPLMAVRADVSATVASARPIPAAQTIRETVRHFIFWYDGAV